MRSELVKKVMEKTNFCCLKCKKPKSECYKGILVPHHIVPRNLRGYYNNLSVIIPLCVNCHRLAHKFLHERLFKHVYLTYEIKQLRGLGKSDVEIAEIFKNLFNEWFEKELPKKNIK